MNSIQTFTLDFNTSTTSTVVSSPRTGVYEIDISSLRSDVVGNSAVCKWVYAIVQTSNGTTDISDEPFVSIATNLVNYQSLNTKYDGQSNLLLMIDQSTEKNLSAAATDLNTYTFNNSGSGFRTTIPAKLTIEKRIGVNQTLSADTLKMSLRIEFEIIEKPKEYLN